MSFKNAKIVGVGVNSDKYHSQTAPRGAADFLVSPSSLKIFSECPARFQLGYEPPASEAKNYGSLLDCLFLTPDQFKSRFAIRPATYPADGKNGKDPTLKPWNGNSNWCKLWIEKQKGSQIVSAAELFEAENAARRLMADETVSAYHAASEKQVHVMGEWHDKPTGLIVPVQCLIDFVPKKDSEFQKSLGDLKTTRNAGQRQFARWCYSAGYHIQAAFDLDLYMAAVNPTRNESGEDRQEWIFILQENYFPYEIGRRLLSQQFTDIGRQTYQNLLARYAKCVKTGEWLGYDEPDEFSLVEAEPFMEYTALADKLEADQVDFEADKNEVPT